MFPNFRSVAHLLTCEELAARYAPTDAFVCDIAATNQGLKVIEFNRINGGGFYLANVDTVVRSLSAWQEMPRSR
ncbi:MAG: hypothetical protein ABIZ35_11405 [Capsulimonas sp.]|uniref:hypothetical protein n=1 Tax=Capsulimonas sp. TaxID=2494211 RepID=UPI003264DA55